MKNNKGFALVTALFVLVVLAAVVGFTVSIASMSGATVSSAIQGARAYFAANSGLEWGLHEAVTKQLCPANTTLQLTQGGLQGFDVSVTCTVTLFTEGITELQIFSITAVATKGYFGNNDYVSREMQAIALNKKSPSKEPGQHRIWSAGD